MSLLAIIARTALGLGPTPAPGPTAITHTAPLVAQAAAPAATKASAAQAIDRVQQFYANIKQVTAMFRQTVTNSTFGTTKTSDGTVWIMKPGKMRWDYLDKKKDGVEVKKTFLSNGKQLYVIEHDNKQVMKKNLEKDLMPVAVSFLFGTGDLKAEFNPELDTSGKYGEKDDIVLKLLPKQPSAQYKSLTLVVSRADYHVSQSVIVDSQDNVNHFRFYAPDFQKPIKDSSFEFDQRSVRNYRVIDGDAPASPAGALAEPSQPAKH